MTTRQPAVAGMFYTGDAAQLQRDVTAMLRSADVPADTDSTRSAPKALIVPHAGYIYSGAVAASAYRLLAPLRQAISRVVLLGPAHRVYLHGMALPSVDAFLTPLGPVPLDRESIRLLKELPGVCISDEAHQEEHSLEVQLPFLQTVLAEFSLLPIVVGQCAPELVADVLDQAWGGPETLIVVSTDLSHYLPYEKARQMDADTCQQIRAKSATINPNEACGAYAINGLLRSEHAKHLQIETLNLSNSGDAAGDKQKVVGYGAFALH